ncbi:MAG: TAXI family TRAP transporter solute-binding subunit, partial [Bdellovibrionota bacterium]
IPMLALVLPVFRAIPKFKDWRIKSRIYQRYGELKFLETQIQPDSRKEHYAEYLKKLDAIEDRVNQMKVPLDYSEHLYGLREHIHFVRGRLEQKRTMTVTSSSPAPL